MNGNGHDEGKGKRKSRLDRIEAALELMIADHEEFRRDHKQLLTAQGLLTDAQRKTEEKINLLIEAQARNEREHEKFREDIREINERTSGLRQWLAPSASW